MTDARVLFAVAAFATATLLGCNGTASSPHATGIRDPSAAAPWPMYQYSANHNAVLPSTNYVPQWSFDAKAKINGGLAIAGNTVLVGTFAPEVIALDARTGKPIWRQRRFRNIVMSTPIVANGLVYVGTGNNNELLFNRFSIAHWTTRGEGLFGVPGGDEVVALRLHDGRVRWRFSTVGENMASAVFDRGRLFFANGDRHTYSLEASTGKLLWKQYTGGVALMASSIVAQNDVIVSQCMLHRPSLTVSLDPDSGRVRWRAPYGSCDAGATYGDGRIFVPAIWFDPISNTWRDIVVALSPRDGNTLWIHRASTGGVWTYLGSREGSISGTYVNGVYYQPEPFGDHITALDAQSGHIRWSFHTAGPVKMSPVISGNHLYAGDTAGVLYDIDVRSGKMLDDTPFLQPFATAPPVIVGETIFLVNGHSVYAANLRRPTWIGRLSSAGRL